MAVEARTTLLPCKNACKHGDRAGLRSCQDHDRGSPAGVARPRSFPIAAGIQQHPIGANRIGDVLEALLSEAGKADIHLVHRVIERRAGDANTAGLGHRLQARGDVYPIAIDVVSLDNDVAEIDADAKPDLLCFGAP